MNYNESIKSDNATRCEAANMDANEVLRRYESGQRNFRQENLILVGLI